MALASEDQELAESAASGAERRAEINPGVPGFLASAVHARGLLTWDPSLLARAVTILAFRDLGTCTRTDRQGLSLALYERRSPARPRTAPDRRV